MSITSNSIMPIDGTPVNRDLLFTSLRDDLIKILTGGDVGRVIASSVSLIDVSALISNLQTMQLSGEQVSLTADASALLGNEHVQYLPKITNSPTHLIIQLKVVLMQPLDI